MDSQNSNDAFAPAADAAVSRRDCLIAALLAAEPDLVVVQCSETAAHLVGTVKPLRILLATATAGITPDALYATLAQWVKTVTPASPPTHLVVVGGGAEVEPSLKRAAPMVQRVPMGFHHLDASGGALVHVSGSHLPLLNDAAWAAQTTEPLTPERLAEALARGEALARRDHRVVASLKGRYRVTACITAACVVLLGLSYLWGYYMHDAALWHMGADRAEAVRRGELWRPFAAAFLHADPVHLLMNMLALWSFGPLLEALLGPRRYVVLYAASALGGSVAGSLFGEDRWSVGASGAIWGLMTAGIGIALRPNGLLPPLMIAGMRRRVWVPLAINLAYSVRPGINMLAHIGGGLVGFVLAATVLTSGLTPVEERSDPASVEAKPNPLYAALAVILSAAMAISVVAAIVVGRPWTLDAAPVLVRTAVADTGLSIEIPSAIAVDAKLAEQEGTRIFTYGDLGSSPLAFEVLVSSLSREVSAGELDEFLEQERKVLDEQAPPNAVRSVRARRENVGPYPGVLVEHDLGKVHFKSFLVVIGAREVIVRGYSTKDRPATWQGIEEKVAATIQQNP